jgi:hypothetical protein
MTEEARVWVYGDEEDDPLIVTLHPCYSAEDVARIACKRLWSERDGYEWMNNGCTLTVDMLGDRNKISVSVDFEPSFYAYVEDHRPLLEGEKE